MRNEQRLAVFRFAALLLAECALDLPFRLAGFLGVGSLAGPASFLPMVAGLLSGLPGIAGVFCGSVLYGAVTGGSLRELVCANLSALCCGLLCRSVWYCGRRGARELRLKTAREFWLYQLLVLACAGLNAGLSLLLSPLSAVSVLAVAAVRCLWAELLGMPVLILLSSVFGLDVDCPARFRIPPVLTLRIADAAGIGAANEAIGALGLPAARGRQLMSCVEELCLLLLPTLPPGGGIQVDVRAEDTVRIVFLWDGARGNPTRSPEPKADGGKTAGLALLRRSALRITYSHFRRENRLMITL